MHPDEATPLQRDYSLRDTWSPGKQGPAGRRAAPKGSCHPAPHLCQEPGGTVFSASDEETRLRGRAACQVTRLRGAEPCTHVLRPRPRPMREMERNSVAAAAPQTLTRRPLLMEGMLPHPLLCFYSLMPQQTGCHAWDVRTTRWVGATPDSSGLDPDTTRGSQHLPQLETGLDQVCVAGAPASICPTSTQAPQVGPFPPKFSRCPGPHKCR